MTLFVPYVAQLGQPALQPIRGLRRSYRYIKITKRTSENNKQHLFMCYLNNKVNYFHVSFIPKHNRFRLLLRNNFTVIILVQMIAADAIQIFQDGLTDLIVIDALVLVHVGTHPPDRFGQTRGGHG